MPELEPPASSAPRDRLDVSARSAERGFGQLWVKRYSVDIPAAHASASGVISVWRADFSNFWPPGNEAYRSLWDIEAGGTIPIELAQGPVTLSTGVVAADVEPTAFTLVTPRGHPFAGAVTFRASDSGPWTRVEVVVVMRASDPLYELALLLGGHRREDRFWLSTLGNLGRRFGAPLDPTTDRNCLDPGRHWSNAANIRDSAVLRGGLRLASRPFRAAIQRATRRTRASRPTG